MGRGDTGDWQVFCGINGEPDHRQFRTAYQHQCSGSNMRQGWVRRWIWEYNVRASAVAAASSVLLAAVAVVLFISSSSSSLFSY